LCEILRPAVLGLLERIEKPKHERTFGTAKHQDCRIEVLLRCDEMLEEPHLE